jgi:biopolymer transport protein TolR
MQGWNKIPLNGVYRMVNEHRWEEAMKKNRRRSLPRSDINVTPFIDILLVLLVIFMTITPLTPTGLKAAVPQPPPPGQHSIESEKVLVLTLDASGIIRINQDQIEASHLVERLQEIFKTRSDRTIFVQADRELLFNDVAQLIDSAKGAGAVRVGLMTEQISGSF